jgi:aspartyl-tRNA synthetase
VFVILREELFTAQGMMFQGETISSQMIKFARQINRESIIEVIGTVAKSPSLIQSCTQQTVEIQISQIFNVHKSAPRLPFNIEDASNVCLNQEKEDYVEEEEKGKKKRILVNQETRLDNRIIDLRVPANKAMFKIQSAVGNLFREFCNTLAWTEIHTPKIIGGTSEGGSEVFRLDYFGRPACLAQSPQLYKQMAIASDFMGVYEIGPVFRAENSNTNRHLCEFVGMDFEVPFKNHYFEVLDIIGQMFPYIFRELEKRYKTELEIVA